MIYKVVIIDLKRPDLMKSFLVEDKKKAMDFMEAMKGPGQLVLLSRLTKSPGGPPVPGAYEWEVEDAGHTLQYKAAFGLRRYWWVVAGGIAYALLKRK